MTKSDDRRAAILGRLADYVLAEGLQAASLRPMAKAAQISDRMLLYYFRDKADVIAATLDCVAQRLVVLLGRDGMTAPQPLERLRADLLDTLFTDEIWPHLCLWMEVASLAARGDDFYRALGERIARGFLAWGAAQLDSPTPEQRQRDAATLLVTIEGMVLLKSVGLDDVCRAAL